jgi:hypothetical protein
MSIAGPCRFRQPHRRPSEGGHDPGHHDAAGDHYCEAGVLHGNDASMRVLQKLGFFQEETRRDYLYRRFPSFRWFSLLETDES